MTQRADVTTPKHPESALGEAWRDSSLAHTCEGCGRSVNEFYWTEDASILCAFCNVRRLAARLAQLQTTIAGVMDVREDICWCVRDTMDATVTAEWGQAILDVLAGLVAPTPPGRAPALAVDKAPEAPTSRSIP